MIWMAGLDMGCFYFNQSWLKFRGRTLEQEQGNGWAEGVHPEDLQRCVGHYLSCFERRIAFAMSYRLQNHRGEYRWILDRGAPHFLADGTFLGFFGGCAEIENVSTITRHAELGSSLQAMKTFARTIAVQGLDEFFPSETVRDVSLQRMAKEIDEAYRERSSQMQHAIGQMQQLADDMASFEKISRGVCTP